MINGLRDFDLQEWLITMVVFIIAITIHEFAHAFSADRLGDPTPRSQGRISINPIDHLDPMGTLLMAISSATGFGFGWGRPVMVQPSNFRNPRLDNAMVALWGPVSNMFQAIIMAELLRLGIAHHWFAVDSPQMHFLWIGTFLNIVLALFNLIPLGPLDGAKVFSVLLHPGQAQQYDGFMRSWGGPVFVILAISGVLGKVIGPAANHIFDLLVGIG